MMYDRTNLCRVPYVESPFAGCIHDHGTPLCHEEEEDQVCCEGEEARIVLKH